MITAEILKHTQNKKTKEELITFKITYPRIILSELNTYKAMISLNTSSSRAIPFEKMVEIVENNPFIPIAFQKDHKGMQGKEYLSETNDEISEYIMAKSWWLNARDNAVKTAKSLNGNEYKTGFSSVTKQICNRLLEPFMWVTQVMTGNRESFEYMFNQRCPNYEGNKSWKDLCSSNLEYEIDTPLIERLKINTGEAEIHFSILAEKMYDLLKESKPEILDKKEWHIPFIEIIED